MKARDRYYVQGVYCRVDGQILRVVDLSVNGLYAVTPSPPAVGETVILELQVTPKDAFRIVGQVSWVNLADRPSTSSLPEGFGLRFTRVAPADRDMLAEVLKGADPVLGSPYGSHN
jgi:Tfp pilus assembly protein PilZ